jgi:hypothetical protein
MSQEEINSEIFARLEKIEKIMFGGKKEPSAPIKKGLTLPELIFGKKFNNGQEKIALILGYMEKFDNKKGIKEIDIQQGWKDGKFDGSYANEFLRRATKSLVRDLKDGTYDLSQTGEQFFDNFVKQDGRAN